MAQRAVIDVKKLGKDLNRIVNNLNRVENIATARSINYAADKSKNIIAKDVSEDHGVPVGTTKRRIQVFKANQRNFSAALFMKDTRITYPKPRKLKKGASFLTFGRRRKSITRPISQGGTGSRPFVVALPSGGIPGGPKNKKAVVYVRPGYTNKKSYPKGAKGQNPRRISTLLFSSLPHLARKDWNEKVQKFAAKTIRERYPIEINKARRGY